MSLSYKKLYKYAYDYSNKVREDSKIKLHMSKKDASFRATVAYGWVAGFISFVRKKEKE